MVVLNNGQRLHNEGISKNICTNMAEVYIIHASLSQTVCKKHVNIRRRGHKPQFASSSDG
jgi:hypothetical protein